MANSDDVSDLEALWRGGISIHGAWWQLATERERDGYRTTLDRGGMQARAELMQASLFDQMFYGDAVAIGIRVEPSNFAKLEKIPAFLFEDFVERVRAAFGENEDTITLAGQRWTSVRVVLLSASKKKLRLPTSAKARPRVRGRPPVHETLVRIVSALRGEHRLSEISRKEQENRVRVKARELHPDLFPKPTQPSRQKILEALRAEAQVVSRKSKKSKN